MPQPGVEHEINVVTQALQVRIGYENRHDNILNIIQSRKELKEFNCKKHWSQ